MAALSIRHLEAWVQSGIPCTILHDPLTVLSAHTPDLVDFADVDLVVEDSGWTSLAEASHHTLRAGLPDRGKVISGYLTAPPRARGGAVISCSLSLDTDDERARHAIATALLGERGPGVAAAWGAFNRAREEPKP